MMQKLRNLLGPSLVTCILFIFAEALYVTRQDGLSETATMLQQSRIPIVRGNSVAQDNCASLASETNRGYESLKDDPNFPKPKCELVVLMAGTPRSGSTLLLKIIDDCLSRLHETFQINYFNYGYWRLDRHLRRAAEIDSRSTKENLKRIKNGTRVVVVKSHRYDPDVLSICDKALVITSTASVTKLMRSYVGAHWVASGNCSQLSSYFNADVYPNHLCWQAISSLRLVYEDFSDDKRYAAVLILTKIAEMLSIEHAKYLEHVPSLFNFPRRYMALEANLKIPSSSNGILLNCKPAMDDFISKTFTNAYQ